MSEYQYYEFKAIDRPLDRKEMDELRDLSTRAEITPTSFTNTYSYGSFRGNPKALMDRYFDAFVYVANWGTRRLMFRIPRRFIDVEAASAYCDGQALSLTTKEGHVVLDLTSHDEMGDGWVDGSEWMPDLIPLRADLMRGDFRALYLGWLASALSLGWDAGDDWAGEARGGEAAPEGGERLEPPVPPGLAKLSGPLRSLADFLRVDDELIEVAAAASAGEPPAEPSRDELARWVKGLPLAEKEAYLLRFLAEEGDSLLRSEMSKRFRETTAPEGARPVAGAPRRTVAQLLAARDALVEEKKRKAADQAAIERARLEREKAEARANYLDELARRESPTWREVDDLIATKRPKEYDRAITLLVDLRDLASRSDRAEEAEARIRELRRRHSNKPALLKRFDQEKLGR
jgi:hypothetical protein